MKKKFLTVVLMTVLFITLVGVIGVAAETSGNLTYEISDGEVTITRWISDATEPTELLIPSEIDGYPVTGIGDYAIFDSYDQIISITIPHTITNIADEAFYECYGLTNISVSENNEHYTSVDGILFDKNRTTLLKYPCCKEITDTNISYSIPNEVTKIGNYAFLNCEFSSIIIHDKLTTIGSSAFESCQYLTSVTIPHSVTSVGAHAFGYCSSLSNINVSEDNEHYTSVDGILFNKEKTILIKYPEAKKDTGYVVPYGVSRIDYAAFWSSYLTNITIPNSVTSIGDYAFNNLRHLQNVYYKGTQNEWKKITIGEQNSCLINATIHFEENYKELFDYELAIGGQGVTILKYKGSLTDVIIPSVIDGYPVIEIGFGAFAMCHDVTDVTIPHSVTRVDGGAFYYCAGLRNINVSENNPYYSSYDGILFNKDKTTLIKYPCGKSYTKYSIPGTVTTVDVWAFSFCDNLTSVTIPNSVTTIKSDAFLSCSNLLGITIPDSVTKIGVSAFASCINLSKVSISNNVTKIDYGTFASCESLISVNIPDGVTDIDDSAFSGCYNLETVVIPDSVKNIGECVFWFCQSLTDITLPNGVTSIGKCTFMNCDSLVSITIPDSVTLIADEMFEHCDSLTTVTIPRTVTRIGDSAFFYCNKLKDVYYKGSENRWSKIAIGTENTCLTDANIIFLGSPEIEEGEFTWEIEGDTLIISGTNSTKNFSSQKPAPWMAHSDIIKKVIVEEGITAIGKQNFKGLKQLESVKFPASLKIIETYAFMGCSSLKSIEMYGEVEYIKNAAFKGCTALENIAVSGTAVNRKNLIVETSNKEFLNGGVVYSSNGNKIYSGISGRCEWIYDEVNKELTLKDSAAYTNHDMVNYRSAEELPWKAFINDVEIVVFDGVSSIGNRALFGASSLENVVIGKSVQRIGTFAFSGSSVRNITFYDTVDTIGTFAFENAHNLRKINCYVSSDEFEKIKLGKYNAPFLNAFVDYIE